jgi:hypothetical protein
MSYRFLTVALAAAGFLFATQAFAEPVNTSKSNNLREGQAGHPSGGAAKAITVNASKSNTYRQGSPAGSGGPAKATTIHGSKANGSE